MMSGAAYRLLPITVSRFCPAFCKYCPQLGCLNNPINSVVELRECFHLAQESGYQGISCPCNVIFSEWLDLLICLAEEYSLSLVLNVHSCYLQEKWSVIEALQHKPFVSLNVICDHETSFLRHELRRIAEMPDSVFTIICTRKIAYPNFFTRLPQNVSQRLHLYFPQRLTYESDLLTYAEIYALLIYLKSWQSNFPIMGPYGIEVFDPRRNYALKTDMAVTPQLLSQAVPSAEGAEDCLVSLIIPTYNNKQHLLRTLAHLVVQDFSQSQFEIIIVDDGSSDDTLITLVAWCNQQSVRLNVKYLFLPRPEARQMGDAQFRAGVARNMGVKCAVGTYLLFLDSDILVPPNYVKQIVSDLKQYDVVQTRRYHLTKAVTAQSFKYNDIDRLRDTYVVDDGYWDDFYARGDRWQDLPMACKYVCTYSLALPAALFKRVGWFRKNYIFYGFEDTDLGYRLVKNGCRLYLSELPVYHLYHPTARSEFFNTTYHRHQVLAKTAKIFFHNNLDPEIYEHFVNFMGDELSLSYLMDLWRQRKHRLLLPAQNVYRGAGQGTERARQRQKEARLENGI